ncbi:MAG: tRNA (N6-isopentenyl adenosine(37)-C2)-methylthiotransferase MiaB [Acidobacteriota bacterium]|nr:tRNA (N6-isopentenyl adenosine(37)-C2)-methylthiotransferase MiaB [Acidobacteriota bacterium]
MKKVYLETFGCQMNVSDSERVATVLESENFEMAPDEDSADIVLFNTCSVREKAEHKLYTRIGQIRKLYSKKKIVGVLGCVAQLEGETLFDKNPSIDFVLGTKAVGRVSKAIESVLEGRSKFLDVGEREPDYDWSVAETQKHSPYISFVPIIEGCNKFCTYCIVPFSRGREKSLPAPEIIRHVHKLHRQGVKEVHLIGQNVNSYRPKTSEGLEDFRGATAFSKLLRAVAATGIARIKFTTSFPRDFHTDIIEAINENENLCNWVHLPVQSGSNKILRLMRRGHTIENYFERIDKIKTSDRKISLTTDIIIGFPNESEVDFQDSLKMVDYCQFDSCYIFKYSPRIGTPAYQFEDNVSVEEKKQRFIELEERQRLNQHRIFKSYLNKTVQVLVEKKSSQNNFDLSGRTSCHKVVQFKGSAALLGKIVDIEITESKSNTLYGKVLNTFV